MCTVVCLPAPDDCFLLSWQFCTSSDLDNSANLPVIQQIIIIIFAMGSEPQFWGREGISKLSFLIWFHLYTHNLYFKHLYFKCTGMSRKWAYEHQRHWAQEEMNRQTPGLQTNEWVEETFMWRWFLHDAFLNLKKTTAFHNICAINRCNQSKTWISICLLFSF